MAGDDVVALRREEDVAAMAVSSRTTAGSTSPTTSTWRVGARPTPADVAPVLGAAIAEIDPTAVFFPMGLANPDHDMTHDACLLVQAEQPARTWFCYEDHGYKHLPGLLAWRAAKLLRSPLWPTPAIVPHVPDEDRKRRAIWCYASQIAPLERDHALTRPHGGPGPRAVLAPGAAPAGLGGAGRPHLTRSRHGPPRRVGRAGRYARGEAWWVGQAMAGCGVARAR